MIELGADIEATGYSGRGPLQAACAIGNEKVARLLIEKGANVNTNRGMVGMTPLHNAAVSGSIEIIELLLARGAKVNAKDEKGQTPVAYARRSRQDAYADEIAKHGGTEG